MPTIAMSDDFFSSAQPGFVSRMVNFNNSGRSVIPSTDTRAYASQGGLLAGSSGVTGNSTVVQIYVMRGTVPTNFTSLINVSDRSADILVMFSTLQVNGSVSASIQPTAADFLPSVAGVNQPLVTVNTNYAFATAAGTATWFWWVVRPVPGGNTVIGNTIANQIIGSIGVPGSGSDLELPSTSIVSGQAYRIRNLVVSFPQSWSW